MKNYKIFIEKGVLSEKAFKIQNYLFIYRKQCFIVILALNPERKIPK